MECFLLLIPIGIVVLMVFSGRMSEIGYTSIATDIAPSSGTMHMSDVLPALHDQEHIRWYFDARMEIRTTQHGRVYDPITWLARVHMGREYALANRRDAARCLGLALADADRLIEASDYPLTVHDTWLRRELGIATVERRHFMGAMLQKLDFDPKAFLTAGGGNNA